MKMGKLKTWVADEEDYKKFKIILAKESVGIGDKINEFIAEYIKMHGDGNPAFSLDQFIKNTEMKAVPAVFRTTEDWLNWLLQINDEEFLQELISKNQTIWGLADKRILELRGHTVKYV